MPLKGNRWALSALRDARQDRGWSAEEAARRVREVTGGALSRGYLGDLERRKCRAAPDHQDALARVYELTVDDLFEAPADVGYSLPPERDGWMLQSAAEAILDMTGEGVRQSPLERRGGPS